MVDESLIAHLTTTCGEEHEAAIRTLFSDGVPPEDPELAGQIDAGLTTVKVLDPACGSGAFPMGALLRMVDILRTVRRIPEDRSVYDLKLELIENAIYGADIQTIAVQISKLRFFISLIAEQQPTDDPGNNYGIHSLPNLETKFVAANSLIGLPHAGDALPMQDVEDLKQHLWEVRHRHFQARSYREKKELRKQDQALRTALAEALEDGGGFDTEAAHLMAAWDPYDQNTSATFLDPEWMFNVRDGFDVVIGNPPYLNVELIAKEDKAEYRRRFTTFYKRYDLFGLFFEAALTGLTNSKGKVTLIVPQQIANNLSYKKLRNLMLDIHWLKEVLYLGDHVFEAANNDVCVITLSKTSTEKIRLVYALDFENREEMYVTSGFFSTYGNVISFKIDTSAESIHEKILSANGGRIDDSFKVFQGIVTGNNTAFLPAPNDISEFGIEEELLKPVLYGRDFTKWAIKGIGHKVLYVTSNTNMTDFPNAERWLNLNRPGFAGHIEV